MSLSSSSSSHPEMSPDTDHNDNDRSPKQTIDTESNARQWNVDICAAVIADKAPLLPLREELRSLGFEVILGAEGVGAKTALDESKQAVEAYRQSLQYHDLQKRRLFPKCKRRIQEKIQARKDKEQDIALPHACSYESYEMRMLRARRRSMSRIGPTLPSIDDMDASVGSMRSMLSDRIRNHQQVTKDFPDLLFLAPDRRRDDFSSSKDSSSRRQRRTDDVPEVFGAFDNLDDDITSGRSGSITTTIQAQHDALTARYRQLEDDVDPVPGGENVREEKKQEKDKMALHGKQAREREQSKFEHLTTDTMGQTTHPSIVTVDQPTTIATLSVASTRERDSIVPQSPASKALVSTNPFDSALASSLCHITATGQESVESSERNALVQAKSNRLKAADWVSSAKTAFDNFSSEVLKVTSCEKRNIMSEQSRVEDPVSRLFGSLTATPDIATLQSVLTEDPALAFVRREQDGRLPLHVLADQTLPYRSGDETRVSLADTLLGDINQLERAVHLLVGAHQGACTEFDKKLDLPVHLMARRLMEWEATWYESVYHSAAQHGEQNGRGATEVSELYHAMSKAVERLLQPLSAADSKHLCQSPGGMGTILPLHIAAIFTVSVRTTRLILEAYPGAAKIPCDLGILRTFVPDECLAIELHDNLSTDFPKWELDQDEEALICNDEDRIRRSDLLFAYNPIEPHRFEKSRISRFELQIQYDATIFGTKTEQKLDAANEKVWLWMCSFVEPESGRATYASSIKRIVRSVNGDSFHHLRDLALSIGNGPNAQHMNDECRSILSRRNDELGVRSSRDALSSEASSNTVDELCRLVFHVPDVLFPTSFVVLPYKLRRAPDGSMSLENPEESSDIASRFAKALIELTEPTVLQDMLKMKWERFDQAPRHITPQEYGDSVMRLNQMKNDFLDLYSKAVGYFYVLDRYTGLPDLQAFEDESYPFQLTNPAETVAQVFPLMLMGMLQMRGNKAIPKLVQICSDKDLSAISPSWCDAVQRLHLWVSAQPDSDATKSLRTQMKRVLPLTGERNTSLSPQNCQEWSSEINTLRTLIDALCRAQETALGTPSEFCAAESPASPKLEAISFADANAFPEVGTLSRDPPVIDVIDLTMKMDTLFEYQGLPLNANGGPTLNEDYSYRSSSPELVFSDEDERDTSHHPEITDVTGFSEIDVRNSSSRYSPLFSTFAIQNDSGNGAECRVESSEGIQVWNEIDRVWEEVEWQLSKRTETLCEDSQILQLKVDLAEQAKMLASLGKKVTYLREKERRFSTRDVEVVDLTNIDHESTNPAALSKGNRRSLFIRLGDLEDRLVCDEIAVQHFSMESHTVEHEGDSMLSSTGRSNDSGIRRRPIPLPAPIDVEKSPQILRQASDATISFSGDESSFRPYGRRPTAPNSTASDQMVEIDSSSSCYSNHVARHSLIQPSVGLGAISRSIDDNTDRSQSPLRDPPGDIAPKVTQRISMESPRSVNERLLIARPFELRETLDTSGSLSKAPISCTALTNETIIDSNSWERGEERFDAEKAGSDGTSPIDDQRARRNLMLLKKLSQESRSDGTPPRVPSTELRFGPRTQKLATRLRSFQEEKQSYDPTLASNASSIFRLDTINVPNQPFATRDYSGLTQSYSLNSRSELATEIDNLILRYTVSDDSNNYGATRRQLI